MNNPIRLHKIEHISKTSKKTRSRNTMSKRMLEPPSPDFKPEMLKKGYQKDISEFEAEFGQVKNNYPITFREDIQVPTHLSDILDSIENNPSLVKEAVKQSIVAPSPEFIQSIGMPSKPMSKSRSRAKSKSRSRPMSM